MSGHNKWSKIKRQKGAADSKRSKVFSRIVKEITVAVKEGGANESTNARLKLAIQNAKGANMPKDTVQRAISKASTDGASLQEVTFEGYGVGGVAIFVEGLTDNNNRIVSNIKMYFSKRGGNLGTNGCLSFIFDRKGVFTIPKGTLNFEELELELIDGGADDIEITEDEIIVTTKLVDFGAMQKKLEALNIEPENAELRRIPNDYKKVDVDVAKRVMHLIDDLEEDDDVQNVYHNMEMTDEIMEALG
ncbi:MAG: transcriptional regulator [Bacteroidetes bacterium RIFOXYA12_FULL_35_11]|nr:MAG: transcriptional regulator [Bacteroidetes bacterium GWF2_35_48]OFY73692.1 MAG: transcriptional regulator [Bacteroidetes bacterium RIFOXYA12_FULL_35_11]OFZ04230.1 MAG: transcriptional regulator [Bacteroidetes bacterium RIFOXYC12_FULL_35_7]HBX52908.1 YebC/PmpR family DNA-binding transcriptional regulator [Bacteroidales bacterium]